MNEILNMILNFIVGITLGLVFFGGLWLTVKKAVTSTTPALLMLVSFVLRIALVLLGFYFIAAGNWQKLLMALAGFIIARYLVIHFTKTKQSSIKKEVTYET